MLLPKVILGTAMWGWTINKHSAFSLATHFTNLGGVLFDTASNYPIDGNVTHFGLAQRWLAEWFEKNPDTRSRVIVKIGSSSNDGSSNVDLGAKTVLKKFDTLQLLFGYRVGMIFVHWDNRDNYFKIENTISAFREIKKLGIGIGLSGIKYPDIYARIGPDLLEDWLIQIKYNIFSRSSYNHYEGFQGKRRFLAYGLNAGGFKMDGSYGATNSFVARDSNQQYITSQTVEKLLSKKPDMPNSPKTLNSLSLLSAFENKDILGVIVGPSSIKQLDDTFKFLDSLR